MLRPILHLGYAFVPLGFALAAGHALRPETIPAAAVIHAWTAGAVGVMTLAVMTRASLGHTGHALTDDEAEQWLTALNDVRLALGASPQRIGKEVAIKILLKAYAKDSEAERRFYTLLLATAFEESEAGPAEVATVIDEIVSASIAVNSR